MSFSCFMVMYSYGDAWSTGAYIRILGPDGQLVYLGVMKEKRTETHTFIRIFYFYYLLFLS